MLVTTTLRAFLYWALACSCTWLGAEAQPLSPAIDQSTVLADRAPVSPRVVVVLAGGGAKGFAHLAVLRRLERDRIPIARIVGTSMGAVIGGLYASGLSTDEIERVIGSLDPARVALDQLERLDLPLRTRAYQRQYPIDLEFGIKGGTLSFARGVSDGQRFLALLQHLTANLPSSIRFDELKIPFRAVATRYRDGEMTVFDQGALHMAIRASMAAPTVFAPVEIDGETYVDGGLVANLPVEVALAGGADVLIASYLGQDADAPQDAPSNALMVANRMLDILIRQNEKRNLAMLRPQDILIQPRLKDVGFTDFNRATDIIAKGEQAIVAQQYRWAQMVQQVRSVQASQTVPSPPKPVFDQPEMRIAAVRVTGARDVSVGYIEQSMASLVGKPFRTEETARLVDRLYTSGFFEQVSYAVEQVEAERYELVVNVNEKPYGPHYFKTSIGFSAELGGVSQFSMGVGYRRPWLNSAGLELAMDGRIGTQSELASRLYQPLSGGLGVEAGVSYDRNIVPVYASQSLVPLSSVQKLGYFRAIRQEAGTNLVYELDRKATLRLGVVNSDIRYDMDTSQDVMVRLPDGQSLPVILEDRRVHYTGIKWQLQSDQLDSNSFPSQGYFFDASFQQSLSGTNYSSARVSTRWAYPLQAHILNLGFNLGRDTVPAGCSTCLTPGSLYLGGFQLMGAYRMAQLAGSRLAHAHATYMYRLSDGGLFKQRTYVGMVLEAGDVWTESTRMNTKYSGSLFIAVDSKMGDIYLGTARGTGGASNLFLQLGRRFSF